jgi:secondary thiamine-phosphate synthase enzyme
MVTLNSRRRTEFMDITDDIQRRIRDAKFSRGMCHIFVPHTTAAVTINESADPSVKTDMIAALNRIVPWEADYRHLEGNSAAHVKSTLVGASEWVAVEDGGLMLGTWQGIFFCEFDGPRTRKIQVRLIPAQFGG